MDSLENIIKYTNDLTLLYVEDNKESRENSMFIFEEFFHQIIIAVDGQDGLEKFQKHKVDIIITDVNMPRLNGLDMVGKIRQIDTSIPILILSAYNESNFFIDSIKLDVEGYLLKPINMKQYLSILTKIVEKAKLREEANKNLNFLKQYQEATDISSIVSKTDIDGNITYINDEFCKISEYSREELIGKNHNIIKNSGRDESFYHELWDTIKIKKKVWQGILRNKSKNNKTYYVKCTIKPILDTDGEIVEFISLMDDITSTMNPTKQFHDLVVSYSNPLIILIKIEDFEDIVKYYGQILMSQIEEKFLDVLQENLSNSLKDEKLFSLGNGEFAMVKQLNVEDSIKDYIKELKRYQVRIDDGIMQVENIYYDLSIQISFASGDDALENAKFGLQELQTSHQNFMVATNLSKKMHAEAEDNIKVLYMIKEALAKRNIVSFFQPIVDNSTKKVIKYESLVRLIDNNEQIITPYFFLEISKKGKYYTQITEIVLENSFAMLDKIDEDISINISAIDIDKNRTRNKILSLLSKYKQYTNRIIFELLEDESIRDYETFKSFIAYVKKLGVKIAIDDFGAGYSNFERLLEYEPDILKIDGSLIKNILDNKYSLNVVETIVTFAKKQNIKLIAEYVENENIFLKLKELGIEYSQGYYFGKPKAMLL